MSPTLYSKFGVLLVDDEPDWLSSLALTLESCWDRHIPARPILPSAYPSSIYSPSAGAPYRYSAAAGFDSLRRRPAL